MTQAMQINASFDTSAASAPDYFKAAVAQAVSNVDAMFTNGVSLDIAFSWGTSGGQPVAGAAANVTEGSYYDYGTVKTALGAKAGDFASYTAANSLPAADPTQGGSIYVTNAQAKALGLGAPTGLDGTIGISSAVNWATAANGSVGAGQFDLVAAIENQITAVMGRTSLTGGGGNNQYSVLDLMRYDPSQKTGSLPSDGYAHKLTAGTASLSFDGIAMKQQFADPATGASAADWSSATQADAFGSSYAGVKQSVTGTDVMEMSAIGWAAGHSLPSSLVVADQNTGGSANAGQAIAAGAATLGHGAAALQASNPASLAPSRTAPPAAVGNVTVDPTFDGFSFANGTVTMSGGFSTSSNRSYGVEVFDGTTDLGAATADSMGGWTFSSQLGDGTHSFTAKVTTSDGSTVGLGTAPDRVVTGIQGQRWQSEVDTLDAAGNVTHQDLLKSGGDAYLSSDVTKLADGSSRYDATGGDLFGHVHFSGMSTVYGQDGTVLERDFTGGDGTPDASTDAGRGVNVGMHDVYRFSAAPGERTVADFIAGGDNHSTLSLSQYDFGSVADVLRATTMSAAGATIQVSPTDSVTLAGVTKAELVHNKGDIALHW